MLTLLLSVLLTGTPMGSSPSVDYNTSQSTTTKNTFTNAFDGDLNTFFASYERSNTWCGLDLGQPYIIDQVGWSPRNDNVGPNRVILGVFEGANSPDFMDAIPLYIIDQAGTIGQMSYAPVQCSRGVRYVRYIGPHDARCNIAEVAFYGIAGEGDDSQLATLTAIPTVMIHTQDNVHPYDKENDIAGTISIVSKEGILTATGGVRLRGNASMDFPKKPYRIKFEKKQRPLDAPAKAKKWTLINNYGDKTLVRNLCAFELSRRLGLEYTPYGTMVDVVFNGEYVGCYQLCDQVEVNEGRVPVSEETAGGILVEVDAYADQELPLEHFYSQGGNPVTIKFPSDEDLTWEVHDAIKAGFDQMEKNKSKYMDYTSFLRHFLVGEIAGNTDTYWSMYMYKQPDSDTWIVGPVWDFDIAFENDYRTHWINDKSDYVYRSGGSLAGQMRSFVDQIVFGSEGSKLLPSVYADARDRGLSAEQMNRFVDSLANIIDQSQKLNFLRWPILNQNVHMNWGSQGSYKGEVKVLKDYITKRFVWMDKKLNYVPSGLGQRTKEQGQRTIKVMEDGQLRIMREGNEYSIMGVKNE